MTSFGLPVGGEDSRGVSRLDFGAVDTMHGPANVANQPDIIKNTKNDAYIPTMKYDVSIRYCEYFCFVDSYEEYLLAADCFYHSNFR